MVLALVFLPACAALSGLADLDVGLIDDAGVDATAFDDVTADVRAEVRTDAPADVSPADVVSTKDAPVDAPLVPDAGVDAQLLSCGQKNCSWPAEVCCHRGSYLSPTYDCESPASCNPSVDGGVFPIPCDRKALCGPQQTCCGTTAPVNPPIVYQVACQSSCGPTNALVLCGAADASPCPIGLSCVLNQGSLPGFYVCK